ncbi:MAG: CaiB/BaiF CoA transferase family protein [Dehalococcoidia bacterium]
MADAALTDVTVLDLSQSVAGAYCTKLLADLGAQVWKLEPPEGDPVRRLGPFKAGQPDPERGGMHLWLNAGKRSLVVDVETDGGRERVRTLSRNVDVLVETFTPGYLSGQGLGYADLSPTNAKLIYASLTHFGQTGPWSGWQGEEIVDFAIGGYMYFTGFPDHPPLLVPGCQGALQLGMQTAFAILAALYHQRETGAGQQLDASGMEAFLSAHSWLSTAWSHTGQVLRRTGSDLTRCKDGWVYWFQGPFNPNVLLLLNRPDLLDDARFTDHPSWIANVPVVRELWDSWCATRTKAEIVSGAQELRIPVSPVNTVADLFASAQMQARDWFVQVDHSLVGEVTLPGFPYKLSGTPPAIQRPAPLLGQDDGAGPPPAPSAHPTPPRQRRRRRPALQGVRILELTSNWAGPLAARLPADLGAEVIKVEFAARPATRALIYPGADPMHYHYNRAGYFNKLNRNKYGISLNLAHPKGRELFLRLVRRADLVIENNSARVMRNLGLDYPSLRVVNPRITLVSMSGYGATGPDSDYVAYGSNVEASSGLASLTGLGPDQNCRTSNYYADPITGTHAAIAALAALHARRRTGEGQFIDLALNEVAAGFFGEAIMDYTLNGTVRTPLGNRSDRCAPQGAYPTAGLDSWLALAVRDDAEFARLCAVIGQPELVGSPRFVTPGARHRNHDTLDERIARWTRTVDHNEAARLLQAAGVPAAPVLANWELLPNPHLNARGFYVPIEHPEVGVYPFPGAPVKLSKTPMEIRMPAPLFAQHNDYVYREILGLDDAGIAELDALGLIDTTPLTPALSRL